VEGLRPLAADFSGVVVGHVLSVSAHPQADRLRVCKVDAGDGVPLQIVCGAPNVAAGMKAPLARIGAGLPGLQIREASLRGVESSGMLCSARELGISEDAEGLLSLPRDAPVGADLRDYLELNDRVFTLKLTPNRADCLSVQGIAREVASLTGAGLNAIPIGETMAVHADRIEVTVEVPAACPRYCGRIVRGVRADAMTPEWMRRRLERSGLRPVSPVVDITNYVLLELGQPLHAFDLNKLSGGIRVRWAADGEKLDLLDGTTASLRPDVLVIADDRGAIAVAGIMGGSASAVDRNTADVFLESAFFAPEAVAGRARRLDLSTDSSHRFERGVDYAATGRALERAVQLMLEICGGSAGPVTEVVGELPVRAAIVLRPDRVRRVLGMTLDDDSTGGLIARTGCRVEAAGGGFRVTPPSWRFDLAIEEDLIEEVARLHGYDRIPSHAPRIPQKMLAASEGRRDVGRIKSVLADRGYLEVICYSFVDQQWERDFAANGDPIRLRNPIASQMSVMRTTLFGSLVDVLRFNLNRRQERMRIFEVGRCFDRKDQPLRVGGLAYGPVREEQWGETARQVDFFDVKSDLEALFWPREPEFQADAHPALHPGQAARILADGHGVGWMGSLHPALRQKYEIPGAAVVFEVDLDCLIDRGVPRHAAFSDQPALRRDISVLADEGIPVARVLEAMKQAAPPQLSELALFDMYVGKGIDSGKKSLAFRLVMQDTFKTMTDAEAQDIVNTMLAVLKEKFDAQPRA
jgi:phenylalanyl-tRNA synthetase beta chain